MPTCPRCHRDLVQITLDLEGRQVEMRSCSSCDQRWWRSDGHDHSITVMLGRVPARQPALR
jgi:hypothetical protein